MLIPGRISLYLSFEKRGLADEKVPVTVCYSAFSISCSSFFEKIFPQEKSPRRCYCPANISKIKKKKSFTYVKFLVDAFSREVIGRIESVSFLLLKIAL